jgi:hypothetical protein
MLGPQPPRNAVASPHALLPQRKSVAVATTEMMWAVALATTQASIASTAHGLALWTRMLRAPMAPLSLITSSLARQSGGSRDASLFSAGGATAAGARAQEAGSEAATTDAPREEASAFASYRSSGGHAAAQIATPTKT